MVKFFRNSIIEITGVLIVAVGLFLISMNPQNTSAIKIPDSLLSLNTIFLSIIIEALPFILVGVLIAGLIQIFVTEEHIEKWIPKNKVLAVIMSCVIGALFPACECGIVPIVRRLVSKGVPIYAAIGFMLTGPLINPIVIASTFMAFGNDFQIAGLRMGLGFVIALIIAFSISMLVKGTQLKTEVKHMNVNTHGPSKQPFTQKLWSMLTHSIDEFFDMGKYLIIGALLAAIVQTYVPTRALLEIGDGVVASLLVMMGLSFVLSLCSEADAFIGASFGSLFPTHSILGFLIIGPMLDLKNTLMMVSVFKVRFVMLLLALVVAVIFFAMLVVQYFV
ncbi:permease [Bacillus sp. PS06]|uniref:permease n=1 Tax=Bacillus sp. PS06 TaxID=2764176 RepID=UPI0017801DD2|nr:permease [Bacillus sp. PS06]MBD8067669.1 permease [Bacillus sp. PS06]